MIAAPTQKVSKVYGPVRMIPAPASSSPIAPPAMANTTMPYSPAPTPPKMTVEVSCRYLP